MPRFKLVDRSPRFIPVVLDEQLIPGSFEHALDHLVDHELDLSVLRNRYDNDETGAPAYDPGVMLKIVLLAYSRGLISSRQIEAACRQNVVFMAISGDSAPQFSTIARFIRELGDDIEALFPQVLLICDAQGLIGRQMFAIDGVKLPSNADKKRSGTHAELAHEARRMERAAAAVIQAHQSRDKDDAPQDTEREAQRLQKLSTEAARIRDFLATREERKGSKGSIRKSNVTDNDSAKMATSKGVIQGYTAVAAVDSGCQVIVAAQAHGSGSEQASLIAMVDATELVRGEQTLIAADAGYHSEDNLSQLHAKAIPALIADTQMRKRDERLKDQGKHKAKPDVLHDKGADTKSKKTRRFGPADFRHDEQSSACTCPAGQQLHSNGNHCSINGRMYHKFSGSLATCGGCELRSQCLRHPDKTPVRQVSFLRKGQASPLKFTERMKQAIDSQRGRKLYGQRMATVEPVFGNIRHNKRLNRFTLRGQRKVNTQWNLYCLMHNIEKLAHCGYAQ